MEACAKMQDEMNVFLHPIHISFIVYIHNDCNNYIKMK